MQINGDAEMGRGLENRKKLGIVQKQPAASAVQESAKETEAADATLQLDGCRSGIFQRQGGESAEPGRMNADCIGQFVIDVARKWGGTSRVQRIETQRGQREDLEVDSRLVHRCNAAGADVEKLRLERCELRNRALAIGSGGLEKGFGYEVLF